MKPFHVRSLVRSAHHWSGFAAAKIVIPAILSVLIIGCRPAAKKDQEPAQVSSGPITASPNPVPAGPGQGSTTISWTGDGSMREVYCSINGGEEQRNWGQPGKTGSYDVNWINAGATYEFRLYRGTEHKELLGTVKVIRNKE
jgi:hypothetical protein